MTLNNFYNEVARRTDTAKTKINAAETRRVLSEAFALLSGMSAPEASDVIAKGMATAMKKAPQKRAPKKRVAKKKK